MVENGILNAALEQPISNGFYSRLISNVISKLSLCIIFYHS